METLLKILGVGLLTILVFLIVAIYTASHTKIVTVSKDSKIVNNKMLALNVSLKLQKFKNFMDNNGINNEMKTINNSVLNEFTKFYGGHEGYASHKDFNRSLLISILAINLINLYSDEIKEASSCKVKNLRGYLKTLDTSLKKCKK